MILRSLLVEATPYTNVFTDLVSQATSFFKLQHLINISKTTTKLENTGRCKKEHSKFFMCNHKHVHTYAHISCRNQQHTMGWLRLVGSLKSQVSSAEYRLFYRAFLPKRPVILKSLRIVATPYGCRHMMSQTKTHKQPYAHHIFIVIFTHER